MARPIDDAGFMPPTDAEMAEWDTMTPVNGPSPSDPADDSPLPVLDEESGIYELYLSQTDDQAAGQIAGQFRFSFGPRDPTPLEVIVLGMLPSCRYYEDEGDNSRPVCGSLGLVRPDSRSERKQAPDCASCPRATWREGRRDAVIVPVFVGWSVHDNLWVSYRPGRGGAAALEYAHKQFLQGRRVYGRTRLPYLMVGSTSYKTKGRVLWAPTAKLSYLLPKLPEHAQLWHEGQSVLALAQAKQSHLLTETRSSRDATS